MPFEGFDFTNFWEDSEYAWKEYVSDTPSDELIASVEQELGYKLPASYIWLMKRHNGGVPANTCFPTDVPTSWAEDHVAITGIFGIGREKTYSLCGSLGGQFMIDEWAYPAIGVAICDCPSAGHDMIFLDYRACGPQGEPKVVHVDQECDYEITPLADHFEDFIRGLVNEEEYEEDEEERKAEETDQVISAPLSPLLLELCRNSGDSDVVNQWIRDTALQIVESKGFFALHDDEPSYTLYDVQFWLYENTHPGVTEAAYLETYPSIIQLAQGFSTGGCCTAFLTEWLGRRKEAGVILEQNGALTMSDAAKASLKERFRQTAAQLPPDLEGRIETWYEKNRHRQIVEAILSRQPVERTDAVLGQLAVAYNNLEEYGKAIEVLEGLRPRQENTPKFHYRLGYAYYYSAVETAEGAEEQERLKKAHAAFTRALILNPPEETAAACRELLDQVVEDCKETQKFAEHTKACEDVEPEAYTEQEMETVERHIEKYFGKFENVWHELVSPDIHVDVCIIPPSKEKDYYTLVTMGMGAHRMNVPEELAEQKLDRAEVAIALPADWKLGENAEAWYWPVRLLKMLARLPGECGSWLGWGHTVDNLEPYADNTELCAALLIGPQRVEDGGEVCILPNGEEVNFYQVIPLYRDEMEDKKANGADALLEKLAGMSFVVQPDRPDALTAEELDEAEYVDLVMDDGDWHLESIHEKGLPVEEITAFNHMAVYLRWCIEHDLMSERFLEKYGDLAAKVKKAPANTDLRPFIRDELQAVLLHPYFNDQGEAFSRYYYGNGDAPYFPADIDDYALQYFGPKRYHSGEFQQEAYLFIPFDEGYYQAMAKVIQGRWDCWQRQEIDQDGEPSALAKAIMRYLDCECQYFPPMADDDPITAAVGYAQRLGVREGFVPMLITVNETLWECLIINADPDSEKEKNEAFDSARVASYRKATLTLPVKDGREILASLLGDRKEEAEDDDMDWESDIVGKMEGGEANDYFLSFWDSETDRTHPLILAQIPVKHPWEVFAWLPFGGWNECPGTADLMAAAKYWFERYGAAPAAMTHDELEFVLPAPVSKEKAMELAAEQYGFCPDVIDQGPEDATIGKLADTLRQSRKWYFWWD